MPCVVSCLSNPSVSLMIGSSKIISVMCSLVSSLEHAVISCPLFVLTVTAVIRCLDVAGSAVASGLVRPVGASPVVCVDAAAESSGVLGGGLYATGSGTVVPAVGNLFSPLLQIAGKNLFSSFGRSFTRGSW